MTDSQESRPDPDAAIFYDAEGNPAVNTVEPERAKEDYPYPISEIEPLYSASTIQAEIEEADSLEELKEVFQDR